LDILLNFKDQTAFTSKLTNLFHYAILGGIHTWWALWLCYRSLRIWEVDAPEPLATIPLPPGTVYMANVAACEHQFVHCPEQDPLLEVQGLGARLQLADEVLFGKDLVETRESFSKLGNACVVCARMFVSTEKWRNICGVPDIK